jgi:hypothetical protein
MVHLRIAARSRVEVDPNNMPETRYRKKKDFQYCEPRMVQFWNNDSGFMGSLISPSLSSLGHEGINGCPHR